MACQERLRLELVYEESIRRWAEVQATAQLWLLSTTMSDLVLKDALSEREAAKNRLLMHKQNCKRCDSGFVQMSFFRRQSSGT
jgi:hypothetical protein